MEDPELPGGDLLIVFNKNHKENWFEDLKAPYKGFLRNPMES